MLLQLLIFFFMGILFGIFTGLIPGIHVNLIGVFLISLSSSLFLSINPIYLVIFIVSLAITHTFIDFIPSVFLGCPDTDTELSVLPGHELLKKGKGYEAVILTAYGSLAALIILLVYFIPFIIIVSKIYDFIKEITPSLLIVVSIILISLEKKRLNALLVFLLTGFLGFCVLNLETEIINQPLLPLLTGLFGSSMLVLSIKNKIKIPKQKISKVKTRMIKPLLGASIAAPLCSFLPGLGSGQAAIIGNLISKTNRKSFLILLGATNTLVMSFSFISLYLISKTRTGAAVAIKELIGQMSLKILILILTTTIFTGIIAFFLTIFLAKFFSKKIEKINYVSLSSSTLIVLFFIVFLVSGFYGILILIISTFTGIYCILLKVRRTNMMGCLLIPVILFYLF
jgi:putative membrane protein